MKKNEIERENQSMDKNRIDLTNVSMNSMNLYWMRPRFFKKKKNIQCTNYKNYKNPINLINIYLNVVSTQFHFQAGKSFLPEHTLGRRIHKLFIFAHMIIMVWWPSPPMFATHSTEKTPSTSSSSSMSWWNI